MTSEASIFETLSGPAAQVAAQARAEHAFQSEAWVQAVAAARGRRHRFVAVRVVAGRHSGACLFGGIHRRYGIEVFESMPMAGYGGWCFAEPVSQDEEAVLTRRWLARSPWWVVSLTGAPGRERAVPVPAVAAWLPSAWRVRCSARTASTHILSLAGDDEALLARARPTARNHLRRVDRSGYVIELGAADAVAEFCRLFRSGSAEWKQGAQDLMPDEFFRRLEAGGGADVWTAGSDGRCLAAALLLKGRTEVFYQASGTVRVRGDVSAIDALLWTAIRHYRDAGFRPLNLGASEGLDSVRFFKEKLGGVAVPYRRATFVIPRGGVLAPSAPAATP